MKKLPFTLIELLIVAAIIAILISLLFPALKKSKLSSQMAVSLSNLKQIGTAMDRYITDNNGKFPPSRYPVPYSWDDHLADYLGLGLTEAEKQSAVPAWRPSFNVLACPLDDIQRVNDSMITRTYQTNNYLKDQPKLMFRYDSIPSMWMSELDEPTETILMNENAKNYNSVGDGSNCAMYLGGNLGGVTNGVSLSGDLLRNPNHHQNNFRNPLLFGDSHLKATDIMKIRVNSDYLWRPFK